MRKNEAREKAEAALRREIHEELSLSIGSLDRFSDVMHEYDCGNVRLIPFRAYSVDRPCIHLTEHVAFAGVNLVYGEQFQRAPAHISILSQLKQLARL